MAAKPSTKDYFLKDYGRTLFPLETTRIVVESFEESLVEQVHRRRRPEHELQFSPQQRCYAAKHGLFVRRTFKLDPVAEYFLYDIVFRNRRTFTRTRRDARRSFGYTFAEGSATSASEAYGRFKFAIWEAQLEYAHWISTDIATYFNSIYHHDLVRFAEGLDWTQEDTGALGNFLKQINVGRSVDCLPQGIHPAKVLGAEFLRFIDDSHQLKCSLILRFQDDIHLFDDDPRTVSSDLLFLQALLGERGLSLNASKTRVGPEDTPPDIEDEVESLKVDLLRRRRSAIAGAYGDQSGEEEYEPLSEEQVQYLLELISSTDVDESDAELVLALLRDHGEEVLPHMVGVLERFPGLSKDLYTYVSFAEHLSGLDELVLNSLSTSSHATEFQLFWLTKLATDFLTESSRLGEILITAYEHSNATHISKAKVVEFPDSRFGLNELREAVLRAGHSDWLAWAAAVGSRALKPAGRNHVLSYFANASPLNDFIAECAKKLPTPA